VKLAIVLYNLGGPDRPEAVKPFLFNLFNDREIIGLPQPLRRIVAAWIAGAREKKAQAIYAHLGGRSPILEETEAQASALRRALQRSLAPDAEWRLFVAMRYWRPDIVQAVRDVKAFGPERVVLVPLYPQFSITTTGSFVNAWGAEARREKLTAPATVLCCYPRAQGFIEAHAALLRAALEKAGASTPVRVLFSAHGLPRRVIMRGDPYQWQIEETAKGIVRALGMPKLDWRVCYQSRVGPMAWLTPSTTDEIRRAGRDGKGLVVVPVAFVSEHSETLVELDIDYAKLAGQAGVSPYIRVPALRAEAPFIEALCALVLAAAGGKEIISATAGGGRICPKAFRLCPQRGR
jgi:ferrochelatase